MSFDALNNYPTPETDVPENNQETNFGGLDDLLTASTTPETNVDEVSEISPLQEKLQDAGVDTQLFNEYLDSIKDSETKTELLELIESDDVSKVKLKIYTRRNGSVINDDTRLAFVSHFSPKSEVENSQLIEEENQAEIAETQSEIAETQSEIAETQSKIAETQSEIAETQSEIAETSMEDEIRNLEKIRTQSFLDLFVERQDLLPDGFYDFVKDGINGSVSEINAATEKVIDYFQKLQNNHQEFQKIAQSFHSAGETEFVEFKTLALQYNPDLAIRFAEFEPHAGQATPDITSELHRAQVVAGLGNNPLAAEKYGQFMEIQEGENITVMNIGVEPPSREVGISGSPMRLERNVPVGDFYESVSEQGLEYERFSAENDDTINAIATIDGNRDSIIANLECDTTIEGAEEIGFGDISAIETQDIDDVKRDIESQLGLPDGVTLDSLASMLGKSLSSRNDIKNFIESTDIAGLLGKLKDEKEAKRLAYQKALRDKSYSVSQDLESGDAIARDVIQNFHAVGLDEIWDELKLILNDPKIISSLQEKIPGFSGEHIDLANGKFGQSGTQENTTAVLRQNITMFANLIYFGETDPNTVVQTQQGEQVNTFAVDQFSRYERGQMISQDSSVGLLAERTGIISGGAVNVGVLKQRLSGEI